MKKVVITGANGFVGSSLVKRMLKANIEVFAIDINFNACRLPESPLVHCIEICPDDRARLQETLALAQGCDAFYHLAWRGVNGPDKTDPWIQLDDAKNAIYYAAVAKAIGCKKFLCAGTVAEQSVQSLPNLAATSAGMIYGVAKHCTHLMLEAYCKNIGLPFVWMQFSNIYGVGNKTGNLVSYTLGELMAGKEPSFGPAEQPYDFIYVDDLIEAVFRLGDKETRQNCYFIGSGKPRILKEYLLEIGELFGRREAVKIGLRPDDGIRYSFEMFNSEGLCKDIGEYASIRFAQGIERTINWLKET